MRGSRRNRDALAALLRLCKNTAVVVYGPYPPSRGRSRWRIQVYCPETGSKRSLTFASEAEARSVRDQLASELRTQAGFTLEQAVRQYLAHKATLLSALSIKSLTERLARFFPATNESLRVWTVDRCETHYQEFSVSQGRYGTLKAATHHAALRNTKEMWRWFVKKGLTDTNPWERVEPIGRANTGKEQLTKTDAAKLVAHLDSAARGGDEGALALLVQIFLGLRSSEVLGLTVANVEDDGQRVSVMRGKTKNARRTLALVPGVAVLLWKHCCNRPRTERVFAQNLARKPAPPWLHKRLLRYCRDAGVPRVCPHSLRGLHSTLAIAGGASTQAVASQLGHGSFTTTQRHYADPSAIDNARNQALTAILPPPAK